MVKSEIFYEVMGNDVARIVKEISVGAERGRSGAEIRGSVAANPNQEKINENIKKKAEAFHFYKICINEAVKRALM